MSLRDLDCTTCTLTEILTLTLTPVYTLSLTLTVTLTPNPDLTLHRYESLEEHELGDDDPSGSGYHNGDGGDTGAALRGAELLAELKRDVTKQVIGESREVRTSVRRVASIAGNEHDRKGMTVANAGRDFLEGLGGLMSRGKEPAFALLSKTLCAACRLSPTSRVTSCVLHLEAPGALGILQLGVRMYMPALHHSALQGLTTNYQLRAGVRQGAGPAGRRAGRLPGGRAAGADGAAEPQDLVQEGRLHRGAGADWSVTDLPPLCVSACHMSV